MFGTRTLQMGRALFFTLAMIALALTNGSVHSGGAGVAHAATAGYDQPGFTNYAHLASIVTAATPLRYGLDWARASAIDSANGYLYMGMACQPGTIAKIRLSDFTVVDTLLLRQGENGPGVLLLDPINGFLYVGTYTAPAQVVKIRLSDFTRVDALTFESGEEHALYGGVIDPAGGAAYFGLVSGHIVKVDLPTFTRVGSVRDPNCIKIAAAAIDTVHGYAYFGSSNSIARVRLADFVLEATMPMVDGENSFAAAAIDPIGGYVYFGTYEIAAGRVVKVRLSDFTKVGTLTLSGYRVNTLDCAVIDPANGYLYFGTAFGSEPGKIARINLSTFSQTGTLQLPSDNVELLTAAFDPATSMAYFGCGMCGARIAKVNLSTFSYVQSLVLPGGESRSYGAALDKKKGIAYFATNTQPAQVVKMRLSDMQKIGSVVFPDGENMAFCAILDPTADYLYVGLDTYPGQIVKVRTSDMTRIGVLATNSSLGAVWCGVMDPDGIHAYFGTYTPGQIVKINLSTGATVGSLSLASDEANIVTADIDPSGTYAYFGSWDNTFRPGVLIKVRLSDFTRVSRAVTSGTRIQALRLDSTGSYAYTGSYDAPAIISKIRLSDMAVIGTTTLDPGEQDVRSCSLDLATGHAYFATSTSPSRVVRVRMSDLTRVDAVTIDADAPIRWAMISGITPNSAIAATYSQPSLVSRVESNLRNRQVFSKVTLPTGANVNDVRIYSHESTGSLYLSLYSDGEARRLLWRSDPLPNTAQDDWMTIPVASGHPTSLTLEAGAYWLGFQTDVPNAIAGCTTATVPSDGCELRQPFGVPLSEIAAAHTYDNNLVWSEYLTYEPISIDVATPVNVSPAADATSVELAPVLTASPFVDFMTGHTHTASRWQVRAASSAADYSETVFDSYDTTTALTTCAVSAGVLYYATDYCWHVCYQDNAGNWSAWSTETHFTTLNGSVESNRQPLQPTNIEPRVEQQGVSTTPRLLVSDFADPDPADFQTASRWRIRCDAGNYSSAIYDSGAVLSSTPSFDVPWGVLVNGRRYFWQACVSDSHGAWSAWSAETSFRTVASDVLPAPEGLRAAAGVDSVWLTWNLSSNPNVCSYDLVRSDSYAGPWSTVLSGGPIRGDEWLDTGLVAGNTYYYRIAAVAADGTAGELSPVVSATVGSARVFLSAARGLPGQTATQMITIDNANHISNAGFQIDIAFDPAKVTPIGVSTTALTHGFDLQSNVGAGVFSIIALGSGLAIQGEGHVLQVNYQVQPTAPIYDRSLTAIPTAELYDDSVPPAPVGINHDSTATLTVAAPVLLGDLNGNGRVTVGDVLFLRQVVAGLVRPTPAIFAAGDVNGDHVLDSADVVLALRLALGQTALGTEPAVGLPPYLARRAGVPAATGHRLSWGVPAFVGDEVTVPICIDQLEGAAGLDIVVNFDRKQLAFVAANQGAAIAAYESWQTNADFEQNDQNGQIRLSAASATLPTGGSGQAAVLRFRTLGAFQQARLVTAKFRVSGVNGENLARTRTVVADDAVLSLNSVSAPTAVNASDATFSDRIRVTWNAVPGASYYQVWRSTEAAGTSAVAVSSWVSALSYDDLTPTTPDTYYYWVRAAADTVGSDASYLAGPDAGSASAMSAPGNVAASDGVYTDRVRVSWDAVPAAMYYRVLRASVSDSASASQLSGWQTTLVYDDTSAVAGQTYYYWVQACPNNTGDGAGPLGGPDAGYRPTLAAPAGVTATDGTQADAVAVTWNAVTGATHYQVWRSSSSSAASAVALSGWLSALTYDDATAVPGTTYYYWAQAAADASGTGAGPLGGPNSGFRPALAAPTDVAASKGAFDDRVRVTWDETDGATHYRVWRALVANSTAASPISSWQTDPVFDDMAAIAGTTYYYWVAAAADASGAGASSLGGPDSGWRATGAVTGKFDYKVTYKNCTLDPSGDTELLVSGTSAKASVKIQRIKTVPAVTTPVPGICYLLQSAGIDRVAVTGGLATFYTDAPVATLQATGSLDKVSTRAARIGRIEAVGRIGAVKMADLANALGGSPTYSTTAIVSGGSPLDAVTVSVTGMILESLATSETVRTLNAASKVWSDRASGSTYLSLSGIGRVQPSAVAGWPAGAYAMRAAAWGAITAKGATVAPDRLTAAGAIGAITAKPGRVPGFEGGTVGQPALGSTALFVAASKIGSVSGAAGISGRFLAGWRPADDSPTYTGAVGRILVARGVGSMTGEAFVADGTALRAALTGYGPAASDFTVWDTAAPKP